MRTKKAAAKAGGPKSKAKSPKAKAKTKTTPEKPSAEKLSDMDRQRLLMDHKRRIKPLIEAAKEAGAVENFRRSKTEDMNEVFARATVYMATRMRASLPDMVVIEAPVPPRRIEGFTNFNTTLVAIGLNGIFVGIARCKGVPVLHAPIAAWKKHFLGKGNLKSAEAKRQAVAICQQLGWDSPDHNGADAAGIWCWAGSTLDPSRATRVEPLFARAAA